MKIIKHKLILTFSIVFSIVINTYSQTNYQIIDSLMRVSYQRGVFNGNIIVSQNNKTIYKNSFGFTDGSATKKITDASIFSVGSIAKEFNAVAIMILQKQGLLSLEDNISKFDLGLPEWSNTVTVKHLLNYSSGLPKIDFSSITSKNDIYKKLKTLDTLNFEPGTDYNYNNNSVFLQKRIVENISKMTFQDFVQENILDKIEIKNSVFDPESTYPNLVSGFNNENKNDIFYKIPATGWLHLTAQDMLTWIISLHTNKIISQSSLNTILKNSYSNNQSSLGYNKYENGALQIHFHHGSSNNFESVIYSNLENNLFIVLMTNNKNFKLEEIAKSIDAIVQGKSFSLPEKSVYLAIREKCYDDIDSGIKYYQEIKTSYPNNYNFSNPEELNRLGYKLIQKGKINSAIKIFMLMVSEFPEESNAYDSLGEAYFLNEDYGLSLKNYKKTLSLNPNNTNAARMIEKNLKKTH